MSAPPSAVVESRFVESAAAFRAFFGELREAFLEREALFQQLELALLCKEHVLILGPPGTAKSAVAGAVLGRIVDEKTGKPSLFQKQLAENTVQTDLIGPVDFKVLTETGRTEHLTDEGMLGAVHAYLDEVFDGRDMLLRSILNVLQERELKHGRKLTRGLTECAVMTSNRYLSEVLQRSPETLQAFADRISFIFFAPKSFARKSSRAQMLLRAQTGQRPSLNEGLTLQQVDVLQDSVQRVEVPGEVSEGLELLADALERELLAQVTKLPDYVPTKYFSHRSFVKALWALKAAVVRDRIYRRPDRRLVAEVTDLETLRHFFLLGGPPKADLDALLKSAVDPRERAQLEIIRVEHKAFDEALARILPTLSQSVSREAADLRLKDELDAAEGLSRGWAPAVASATSRSLREKLVPGPRHAENRAALLRVGQQVVSAFEKRLAQGTAGQGEGRAGVTLLGSLSDCWELVRRVPELQGRTSELSLRLLDFCRQEAEMTALAAEGTAFDDTVRLDALAGIAHGLVEELSHLSQMVHGLTPLSPGPAAKVRDVLAQARERVARAVVQRAQRYFDRLAELPKKSEPLEQLVSDSRRLAELEAVVSQLSPGHKGLKERLLAPLAENYVRELVIAAPMDRLDSLVRVLHQAVDNLRREGAAVDQAMAVARDIIERRTGEYAQAMAKPLTVPTIDAQGLLSGEAYTKYRQALAGPAAEAELGALNELNALLSQVGLAILPGAIGDAIEIAGLQALSARVRFVRSWMTGLLDALPEPDQVKSRAEADRIFEHFVRSRLPMLVTREGELLRLESAVGRMKGLIGERGEAARGLDAVLRTVIEDFGDFSRGVLEARGQ